MTLNRSTPALLGVTVSAMLALASGALGQALPQLANDFRNVFSAEGLLADPEPPGPTARTGSQFQSGTPFGGWQTTRIKDGAAVVAGSANEGIGDPGAIIRPSYTPRQADGETPIPSERIQLAASVIGRPLVLRTVSFSLGSEIPRPDRKANGTPLDPNVFAEAEYYLPKPANAEEGSFYWSDHAQKVFATEPGTVVVEWEERVSGEIFSQNYTVSGSPSKPAKKIYWTERGFNGPLVEVPEARVAEVNIVYNSLFKKQVAEGQDYQTLFDPPVDPDAVLVPERRTLWFNKAADPYIHAYNLEGRVFVELLGDLREPDRIYREHLGYEIVDVIKEVRPDELRVSIGEKVLPVDEAELSEEDAELVADVVAGINQQADPYLYEHLSLGGTSRDLYAVRETTPIRVLDLNDDGVVDDRDEQQSNEVLIYWKEAGVMQLLWPKSYVGYIFKWPEEYLDEYAESDLRDYYSIYARPELGTDSEASGVQLNSENNPHLTYQDDETRQHAQLTPQNVFYTVPGSGNRSLIRYTDGDDIWFQRVYSIVNEDFDGYGSLQPAVIGTRIDPPAGIENLAGYIRQTTGNAFNVNVYRDPFLVGFEDAAEGAIIPVNAIAGNDELEVWWYEESLPPEGTDFTSVQWPSQVRRYQLEWPVTDENDGDIYDEIVMARNDGSGELGIAAGGSIYRQPDPASAGYNPNEEHALMSGGVAWALRDDLNLPESSEPFVLVDYIAEDERPAMVVRRLVRENDAHTFDYEVPVGVILQAPMPLPVIPLPIDDAGAVRNIEVGDPTDIPRNFVAAPDRYLHYDRFTFIDRKGSTWIYRGVHDQANEGDRGFSMHYFYKTQAEFDFPGMTVPAAGTIVPYLRPVDEFGAPVGDPIDGDPQLVNFIPIWPTNPPILNVAETLGLPKRGLPAVRGQTSAELLYQQSVGEDIEADVHSAKLFDPTRAKVFHFTETGLSAVPGSIATSNYLGKTYFPQLPPHLSTRLFLDPNVGELGALVFIGEFIDAPLGEDYFQLNVMSPKDVDDCKALVAVGDIDETAWQQAIDGLSTTMETFIEDPSKRGTYIVDENLDRSAGPMTVAEVVNDDTAVDSYAISAAGGGTGFVVMAAGNGEAFTPIGEPVSLQVFRVASPLYRGELKVVQSANPLDEKLTLQHSGDFAGDPSDFEFAWITGQPVDGFPPELYSFGALEVLANGAPRSWKLLNNPAAGYEEARAYGFDDSGWLSPGNLSANQIIVNDGEGTADHGAILPHAILRDEFDWPGDIPIDLYLSFDIAANDGAAVYLNGAEIAVWNVPNRENSFPATAPGTLVEQTLSSVISVAPESLVAANTVTVELYTSSNAGSSSSFDLRLDSQQETASVSGWQDVTNGAKSGQGEGSKVRHTIEGATIFTLTDNYFTMRYRAKPDTAAAIATGGSDTDPGEWSRWMSPQLAEGWIKRALGGINPFEQRITDLFNNSINSDVSLLTQAGGRWEGDIALNLANIDDFGLIEIYETILRRGKSLSIDGAPPLNVPAANDALLLAAGYLNDLYMVVGNEAFADASNPTIAFSTEGGNGIKAEFGNLYTSLFAFKGQLASVLDEELALLRGRDDRFQPGVELSPVYNRLVWNFTNGINSGEAVYALNYNIKDLDASGAADAVDAVTSYPQGHGDAYGHYLTALKGYYSLLSNENFAWTPRIEAVSVLGQPVSVDYQDERKFAASAASLARSARQIVDLTYREQFENDDAAGWTHLKDGKVNDRTGVARHWGTDEWACRGGQGAFFHWVTANSILPETDLDPDHEGIQKVDRTTVPELDQVVGHAEAIQLTLDEADARLNPLGLAKGALSFDISPSEVDEGKTHFEQVYDRAVTALNNAKFAFERAEDSTRLLRGQGDTLDDQVHAIALQEAAYENELVELYGTPYSDDVGPGKTYSQGYEGPDYFHYAYVDTVELFFRPEDGFTPIEVPADPAFVKLNSTVLNYDADKDESVDDGVASVVFHVNSRGEFVKPEAWSGRRSHPGQLQAAISDLLTARIVLRQTGDIYDNQLSDMVDLLKVYQAKVDARDKLVSLTDEAQSSVDAAESGVLAAKVISGVAEVTSDTISDAGDTIIEALPRSVGFSNDVTSPARAAIRGGVNGITLALDIASLASDEIAEGLDLHIARLQRKLEVELEEAAWKAENRQLVRDLQEELFFYADHRAVVDAALRDYDQAERHYRSLIAKGFVIQKEREVFRKRSAAIVQGYRTRDFAFRVFRDEALEKYKSLFDLASQYTFLAAKAYDYETGLLDSAGSSAAGAFFNGVVQSRSLGVLDDDGKPQFGGSETGDPGLAGVLTQMDGDWSVAKSRLGFNNPDNYRTTFSLREENYRIIPGEGGNQAWADKIAGQVKDNLLDDPDIRRHCMQIAGNDGLPVPGIVIPFQTTIADGVNFFGQPLAGGDHTFSPTSFATKIRASGIAFKGYVGMDSPTSTGGTLDGIGADSPADPDLGFLDQEALSATPYIYLIPAGVDSMRSPPLGDSSFVRTWAVDDQAIPLPFNIGNTDFSENSSFTSSDSLSEDPFAIRKHQAFRAVPSGTVFSSTPGFTNSRLIGRSAWNSNWKLVIPGKTLRANPYVGMEVFLKTVKDIELFLETYSYSGN